ncbi:MAG TPA: ferritin-like protein [Solirubrobacterales bacterium]|nr:ferritin-like protein [Solirubrobacterales bacterium]
MILAVSYLGYPRIHFSGRFQGDVSTVNNATSRFDDARFAMRYQRQGVAGSWNPRGSGAWRLRDCRVTGAVQGDGSPAEKLSRATLKDAGERVSAKLVDLDPQQQGVSMIFGLRLSLQLPALALAGDFGPTPFSDLWPRFAGAAGNAKWSAAYQSTIAVDEWGSGEMPQVVQELRELAADDRLSIKFTADGYDADPGSPNFTWGRIVGAIGPYLEGEPRRFVAARSMVSPPGSPLSPPPFSVAAPLRVDPAAAMLFLDLGNALPTVAAGGDLKPLGLLRLVAQPAGGQPLDLATIEPTTAFYQQEAAILSVRLTPEQLAAVAETPLALIDASGETLLAEDPEGRCLRADDFVFRMSPGDTAKAVVYATRFGQPAPGVPVSAQLDDSELGPTPPPVNEPEEALAVGVRPAKTGKDGRTTITLKAGDPGNPRGYIDGQVYGVAYGWDGDRSLAQGNMLSALVWDAYEAPAEPTWVADVQPILQQYANLYPAMRDVLDLADYDDVVRHSSALQLAMGTMTPEDANYMPVTRDLSPAKRDMVVAWLKSDRRPAVLRIRDVESLRQVLQLAIQLEHATIPPYLCALFSILPGANVEVADLIRSVVMEEMFHMVLVCNLLNAVGGQPRIGAPGFVPRYPGHLPAGVRPDLNVTLRKCSKEHIRDVFMAIELPADPVVPDDLEVPSAEATAAIEVDEEGNASPEAADVADQLALHYKWARHKPLTIGWFYQQIGLGLIELCKSGDIFTGDPDLQITPAVYPDAPGTLYAITGTAKEKLDSAILALNEIERQGEGTSHTNPTDSTGELAHYYRFEEIVEGRHLVEDGGRWSYSGEEIPFDPAGVAPMADDPDTGLLPAGSRVRLQSEVCDKVYGDLLRSLHAVFNGQPAMLGQAVGLMFSLEVQARELLTTPVAPGSPLTAGPSFQAL